MAFDLPRDIASWLAGKTAPESRAKHQEAHTALHRFYHHWVISDAFDNLHDAAAGAVSTGKTLYIVGAHSLSETLRLRGHTLCDPSASIRSSAAVAIQLGVVGQTTVEKVFQLPAIQRTGPKWLDTLTVGADMGIQALNVIRCKLEWISVRDFSVGVALEGHLANGCSNNQLLGLSLVNNAISVQQSYVDPGFVTEIDLNVRQMALGNHLGTDIPGTRILNILSRWGNNRYRGNIEGNAAEYMLYCPEASRCEFDVRWEKSPHLTPPRAYLGAGAWQNILKGHNVWNVAIEKGYADTQNNRQYVHYNGQMIFEAI